MKACVLMLLTLLASPAFAAETYSCAVGGTTSSSYFPESIGSVTVTIDNDKVIAGNLDGRNFTNTYSYDQVSAYIDIGQQGEKTVMVNHDIGHDMQTLSFSPVVGTTKGNIYEFIDCLGETNSDVDVTCDLVPEQAK